MNSNRSSAGFDLTPPTLDQRTSLEADLTVEESDVLLRHGTEATFCGGLLDEHRDGVFTCRLCGLPLFLAGHAGGALKGGLHVKAADGTPMANAMLSVLHKLGLQNIDQFGDSTGELDLNQAPSGATSDTAKG